jgi:tetratricopeptide (TPR) repeat protein/anti-sigma regulatory factor (Ser/Thr protein kinase)
MRFATLIILPIIFIFSTTCTNAQQTKIDSLKLLIAVTKEDTLKINLFESLGQAYRNAKKIDSSVLSYKQALAINKKGNYSLTKQCWNIATIDYLLYEVGNYSESLKYAEQHLALSEQLNDTSHKGYAHLVFGHDYSELGEYRQSLNHYFKAKEFFKLFWVSRNKPEDNTYTMLCISGTYLKMNKLDSALIYTQQAYKIAIADSNGACILLAKRIFGDIYFAKSDDETALNYYRQYVPDFVKYKERNRDLGFVLNNMAKIFQKRNQNDSAVFYAKKALGNAQAYHDQENIYDAATSLYNLYKGKDDYKTEQATNEILNNTDTSEYNTKIKAKMRGLKSELALAKDDSIKIDLLMQLGDQYRNASKPDSFIICYQQALELVQKNKYPEIKELRVLGGLDFITNATGNYLMSMNYANRALLLSEQSKDVPGKAFALSNIAANYAGMGDLRKALDYYFKAKKTFETYESGHWAIQNIAETYLKMHKLDSALYYNQKAYYIADTGHNQQYMKDFAIRVFAKIYAEQGKDQLALKYYRQFIDDFYKYNLSNREIDRVYFGIAEIYRKQNAIDSSVYYAKKALAAARIYNDQEHILITANLLYNLNDSMRNESEAFKYFKIATAAKDSMAGIEKIKQVQILTFNEQVREKEQAKADAKAAARTKLLITIAAIIVLIISFLVWTRIRQLRMEHKMIMEQKETEKLKAKYEKDLIRLEAKALRAQMNPHFIFNCLNSIKSLINKNENDRAAVYLITFSKLIRTLFQNADKREVSLFEELETCKLYTQLEKLRFDDKVEFVFDEDKNIDLKDIKLPALILQPFIENAIWHGLVTKDDGGKVIISIKERDGAVECIIDDNGIGRELSQQYKAQYESTRQSKGIGLTQSRLELDKVLNDREDSFQIIDKINEAGVAEGTKVIITFKENRN